MSQELIREVEKAYFKTKLPSLLPGATVRMHVKIIEGGKERTQVFEGVILRIRGSGLSQTVTVRKVVQGIGVERTFLVHSPKLAKIEVKQYAKVRRARLYYLRERQGKSGRLKIKRQAIKEKK